MFLNEFNVLFRVAGEICEYLNEPNADCRDITAFWQQRTKSYPILSLAFEAMSAIPATSVAAEHPFWFGNVDAKFNNLNEILVLQSHAKWNPALILDVPFRQI